MYQIHPLVVQLDVKLTYSSPLIIQESLQIKGDLAL